MSTFRPGSREALAAWDLEMAKEFGYGEDVHKVVALFGSTIIDAANNSSTPYAQQLSGEIQAIPGGKPQDRFKSLIPKLIPDQF